jgi:hypothetical protein
LELQTRRKHLLNLLHQYLVNDIFPKNYDYSGQRKPCFIDKDGAICAVGYLVEQTAGREVAEKINSKYKYEELLAMNDETLDNWILSSGLTKEECAMIQPAYGGPGPGPAPTPVYENNNITSAYGISSSVLGGVNLSLSTINGMQIWKGATKRTVPIIGLIAGAGQIVLGAAKFPKDQIGWNGTTYTNENQKKLSMINIGLGTTTMISAWNLITNNKNKEKATTWNVYSFPTQNNNMGFAFGIKRKF